MSVSYIHTAPVTSFAYLQTLDGLNVVLCCSTQFSSQVQFTSSTQQPVVCFTAAASGRRMRLVRQRRKASLGGTDILHTADTRKLALALALGSASEHQSRRQGDAPSTSRLPACLIQDVHDVVACLLATSGHWCPPAVRGVPPGGETCY